MRQADEETLRRRISEQAAELKRLRVELEAARLRISRLRSECRRQWNRAELWRHRALTQTKRAP